MAKHCPAIFNSRGASRLRLADELRVQVRAEAFNAAFGTVAGLLDAAERRLRRRDGDRVDADHARLDRVPDGIRRRARRGEGEGGKYELERNGAQDLFVV